MVVSIPTYLLLILSGVARKKNYHQNVLKPIQILGHYNYLKSF